MTLAAFIAKNRVRMTAGWADSNPNMMSDPEWARSASHWKCQLRCQHRTLTTYFSQGAAHSGEPDIKSVIDCLASDAAGAENNPIFDDWCAEYGYDVDSRKAERTFNTVKKQAAALKRLLGEDAYKTLLWDTDRE